MNPAATDKKTVRVSILNQTYAVVTTGDPADVEQLAHTVDELMNTYAKAGADTTRACVLASLHLADQLRAAQKELDHLKQRVDAKSREFSLLLDAAVE